MFIFEYKRLSPVYRLVVVLPLNYCFIQGLEYQAQPYINNKKYIS